ncbi:MAG: N-acetylmuramoyl-L-alanine amidase [Cyclobacteriaceae bacterium]|nr:N-acetylmuramoyl-L-alanine amidase [Cyclobacteriaceae bacterium]
MSIRGIILFSFLFPGVIYAQTAWKPISSASNFIQKQEIKIENDNKIYFSSDFTFTAIAFKVESDKNISNTSFSTNETSFPFQIDEHVEENMGMSVVQLKVMDGPVQNISIFPGEYRGNLEMHLIDGRYKKFDSNLKKENQQAIEAGCIEPSAIDQSVWRVGLPSPTYTRSFTNVTHLIIHHSAGSNTAPDYTEVVRSIYLYHTETNGWSDIGYNYLISPDGTLYRGRDPDGGEQDNVQGAHFCGKNSNTMGICLMGTYTTVPPTQETLATLNTLLAWKSYKDTIYPNGGTYHSGVGSVLYNISGHRDGCTTECPGTMTYSLLSEIRNQVTALFNDCDGVITNIEEKPDFSLYPNPVTNGYLTISIDSEHLESIEILNIHGQSIKQIPVNTMSLNKNIYTLDLKTMEEGNYLIKLTTLETMRIEKIIICN